MNKRKKNMEKKQDVLKIKQDIFDSVQISENNNLYINNVTMSAPRFHENQKYLTNRNSELEISQTNPISMSDNINDIDLLRLNNKSNKLPTFSDGLKENKHFQNFQQVIESNLSDNTKQKICRILREVSSLSAQEKLFLYLRLPPENTEYDPFRHSQNPLGSRAEINETITWVRSHLKHDPKVSIPKQDVYNDYTAYCTRLDIKPLSTADFGKVMKQVFPEIKPRRLGTRGHSRYCYAAMRKANKLFPPSLPKMKSDFNSSAIIDDTTNDSWQIIKMWSEELLNSSFQNIAELSAYISKHNLNTQQHTSSKILFQKKKMQREIKSKRKYSESLTSKKRRKKKSKIIPCTDSFQRNKNSEMSENDLMQNVKLNSDKNDTDRYDLGFGEKLEKVKLIDSPLMPINLTSDEKTYQINSNNNKNQTVKNSINMTHEENILFPNNSSVASNKNFIDIKEEFVEEYSSNILCKKVRQAQQSKGLWVPPSLDNSLINPQNYVSNNNFLMGPPQQIQPQNLTAFHSNLNEVHGNKKSLYNYNQHESSTVISKNLMQLSAKKNRIMQNKNDPHIIDSENIDDEKNVLPENLGLPRERVISICNMDKHELDDYLIGDNSQEQEAELLQYFQPEEANGNENLGHGKFNTNSNEDAVEISQLRHYLHQNFQHNKNVDNFNNQRSQNQQTHHHNVPYTGGSASASLAIMSQRHLNNRPDQSGLEKPFNVAPRRKLNISSMPSIIAKNANSKRKNFSFVPISLNSNVSSGDNNKFVSPKSKYNAHKTNTMVNLDSVKSSMDYNLSDPMIGAIPNVISASAPPSPSIMHQNSFTMGNHFIQNVTTNSSGCNFNEMVEYRSRSVPLHNNGCSEFHKNESMTGFLSSCNSVTPTPIPTEFNDFNEPLLDFFSDANMQQPNQIDVPLLDINIPLNSKDNERRHNKNLNIVVAEKSESLNYISRSNPCTPLNINNSNIDLYCEHKLNENNKIFDASKSVPTTPSGFIGHLRYSPEIINGCLINNEDMIASAASNTESIINSALFKNL